MVDRCWTTSSLMVGCGNELRVSLLGKLEVHWITAIRIMSFTEVRLPFLVTSSYLLMHL